MSYDKYRNTLNEEQSAFVVANFQHMTNKQMAEALQVKLWQVRYALYPLGLKRMEMEYWTEEQVQFLRDNYQTHGDKELAEMFTERWHKNKGWHKRHMEKKRRYLKLNRTEAEKGFILIRNRKQGRYNTVARSWEKRGFTQVGDTADWPDQQGTVRRFIKTEKGFTPMAPLLWEQHYGKPEKGHNVCFKDGNPLNCIIENLFLLSNADNARRISEKTSIALSDNYVAAMASYRKPELRKKLKQQPELLKAIRLRMQLEREIKKQQLTS